MLTAKQKQALDFIEAELARTGGVAPSYREIAQGLGMRSYSSAHRVVMQLEQRGLIRSIPGKVRTLEVVRAEPRAEVSAAGGRTCG